MSVSCQRLKILTTTDFFKAAELVCVNALSRREHSRTELLSKLSDFDESTAEAVLDYLAERGWQSDERFAEQYVRSKSLKGDGPLKVKQGLNQRGISSQIANAAIASIDWFEIAKNVYAKKYTQPWTMLNEKAKRQRFLAQRGFTFEQIKNVMNYED